MTWARPMVAIACLAALTSSAVGAVQPYAPTPGAVASKTYEMTADGHPIAVEHFKDVGYARFAFTGKVEVAIKVAGGAGDFVLSPLRRQIPVERRDGALRFTVDAPCQLVLQCEGKEKLLLFADAPEIGAPRLGGPDVIDVRDYLDDRSGTTLQRDQIQRALDLAAARKEGAVVYFPGGTYLTGTLVIRGRTTVYLESGALLQGTANPKDYYVAASEPPRSPNPRNTGALLYFVDADGARLIGRGTVAGRGTEIRKVVSDHPRICNLVRSRNCEIADVVIRDSGGFNIHALRCENLRLHGYKIINDLSLSNQDGTDPDSSKHVVVEDVFMYTSDDAIAVKADLGLCEDVVVRNCVFWTKKSALKVGSDPHFGARNIVFEHNDVLHADRALALYARQGFIEHTEFRGNTAEMVGGDIKQQLIVFLVSKRGPDGETSARKGAPYTGYIRDVLVDGFDAARPSPNASVIRGDGPGHAVSRVQIRNFYLAGEPVRAAGDARIEVGPDAESVTFATSGPAPASLGPLPAWVK